MLSFNPKVLRVEISDGSYVHVINFKIASLSIHFRDRWNFLAGYAFQWKIIKHNKQLSKKISGVHFPQCQYEINVAFIQLSN